MVTNHRDAELVGVDCGLLSSFGSTRTMDSWHSFRDAQSSSGMLVSVKPKLARVRVWRALQRRWTRGEKNMCSEFRVSRRRRSTLKALGKRWHGSWRTADEERPPLLHRAAWLAEVDDDPKGYVGSGCCWAGVVGPGQVRRFPFFWFLSLLFSCFMHWDFSLISKSVFAGIWLYDHL
jgi:hypothetical protein